MSGPIQLRPVSPVSTRPAVKRDNAKAVAPVSAPANNPKPPPQPFEPAADDEQGVHLTIAHDEGANAFVYRSIDSKTGDVVWQYPVEQVLRLAHRLRELEGLDEHQVDEKI